MALAPAYIHISAGTPGVDHGEGHIGKVLLRFPNATLVGELSKARGRITGGDLSFHGESHSLVPLPFALATGASLSLVLETGATLKVTAPSAHVTSVGPTRYVEQFTG